MTSLFKGTRGISPLVATVLLIAFSVALGAVVMSWGESYIEQRAEFVSGRSEVGGPCDTALVTIIKVKDQIQICERDNTLELFVESGPQRLVGIKARVLGADSVFLAENILASPLEAASAIKTAINHGAIWRFLTKPWDDEVLRKLVREAFREYDLRHGKSQSP